MANYYTKGTLTPPVRLTKAMRHVIGLTNGSYEVEEKSSLLEDLAAGEENSQTLYYVFWEDSFSQPDEIEVDERVESNDFPKGTPEEAEFRRLAKFVVEGEIEYFLREVLLHNPDVKHLELRKAEVCDKMRADAFGGEGIYITRKQFGVVNDHSLQVDDETGEIKLTRELVFDFDPKPPAAKTEEDDPPRALTGKERDLILAALRVFQRTLERGHIPLEIEDIARNGDKWDMPDSEDIDELCENLNCGVIENEPDSLLEKIAEAADEEDGTC